MSICCIDVGFDFLHPGLVQDVGQTEKVRALWLHDMVLPAVGAASALPGRRFSEAELQAGLDWYNDKTKGADTPGSPAPDAVHLHLGRLENPPGSFEYKTLLQQHGTAVCGIAAGNGRGTAPTVTGVASSADLLLVALGDHDEHRFADSTQVSAAFQAAFADPSASCVALMADSDNLGPHDGSLHGERALDDLLLTPGRAIVLTAGNLNQQAGGSSSTPAYHAVADFQHLPSPQLVLHYGTGASWPDTAEVWFQAPQNVAASATIAMKVRGVVLPSSPTLVSGGPPVVIFDPSKADFSFTTVTASLDWSDDAEAWCLSLVFRPNPGEPIVRSEWTITVTSSGLVHAWLDRNNEGIGYWIGTTSKAGANQTTLGSPSTAVRPLVVGSVADATGRPSVFSGCGPVRYSPGPVNLKPDLVAVGENVPASLGHPGDRWKHQHPGTDYTTFKQGTSYAAPQVAGACALLFEQYGPAATWADIRQGILQAVRRTPAMPTPDASGWDPACGFGMLDLTALPSVPASASTAQALPPPVLVTEVAVIGHADLWLPKAPGDNGAEPFVAATFWNSPALVLVDEEGQELAAADVAAGLARPHEAQDSCGQSWRAVRRWRHCGSLVGRHLERYTRCHGLARAEPRGASRGLVSMAREAIDKKYLACHRAPQSICCSIGHHRRRLMAQTVHHTCWWRQ